MNTFEDNGLCPLERRLRQAIRVVRDFHHGIDADRDEALGVLRQMNGLPLEMTGRFAADVNAHFDAKRLALSPQVDAIRLEGVPE